MGRSQFYAGVNGLKAPEVAALKWTLNSYDKVNPTSLFGYNVQRKKNCFTSGTVITSLNYIHPRLVLTIDQWLCLSELYGTTPSQTAKHHGVCNSS